MNDKNANRFDVAKIGLFLAGTMCVVPFLQPRHFPPIRTFYDEWLAFAFGLAAAGLAAFARKERALQIPALSLCLGLFALAQLPRIVGVQSAYPQLALLWALYAAFAAVLVILGRDLATRFGQEQTCDLLAAFLIVGAAANSLAGLLQVIGIPRPIDAFVSYLHGTRAIGNVGQPNLYANYLALGCASICYLVARGKLSMAPAAALGLFILTGMALSASRSSLLYLGLFLLLGWIALRKYQSTIGRRLCISTIGLAIAGSQLHWLIPAAAGAIGFSIVRGVPAEWAGADPSSGLRLIVWKLAWNLFKSSPWTGVGPGEFSGAAFAHGLPIELAGAEVWTSAHNVLLQLMSETGVIGTLPIAVGLVIWAVRSNKEVMLGRSTALWWISACVGVELVHAMVEYPLWYGNFLAVTALLAGIGAGGGLEIRARYGRMTLAGCAFLGGLVLTEAVRDYARYDLARAASSGRSLASADRVTESRMELENLRSGLLAPRIETSLFIGLPLDGNDLAAKIELGDRVLRVWPSIQVTIRLSIYLALAGRNNEAQELLHRAFKTSRTQRNKIIAMISEAPQPARSVLQSLLR